jgi:Formylmethanofuran dehydrogenase subunit B
MPYLAMKLCILAADLASHNPSSSIRHVKRLRIVILNRMWYPTTFNKSVGVSEHIRGRVTKGLQVYCQSSGAGERRDSSVLREVSLNI